MIVGIMNFKGGTGKTAICVHLAWLMAKAKKRVLVVDLDPQGDACKWLSGYEWRKESRGKAGGVEYVYAGHPDWDGKIDREDYDVILVDGRPDLLTAVDALDVIDVCIVPVKGRLSWGGCEEMMKTLAEGRPDVKVFVIRNELLPGTWRVTQEELSFVRALKWCILVDMDLPRTSAMRQAEFAGKAVWEMPWGGGAILGKKLGLLAKAIMTGDILKVGS